MLSVEYQSSVSGRINDQTVQRDHRYSFWTVFVITDYVFFSGLFVFADILIKKSVFGAVPDKFTGTIKW